jgi:hypothetical protein
MKEEFEVMIKNMSIDQMPNDDMRVVAQECGVDVARLLLRKLRGASILIPRRCYNKIADKFILEKFDGTNAKKLASVCSYSLRNVYRVVENEDLRRKEKKPRLKQFKLPLFPGDVPEENPALLQGVANG